jgi:hypothetical protein
LYPLHQAGSIAPLQCCDVVVLVLVLVLVLVVLLVLVLVVVQTPHVWGQPADASTPSGLILLELSAHR